MLSPCASSRNLANLSDSLDLLDIRDPERCLNQMISGSRVLKNPNAHKIRIGFFKSRDDEFSICFSDFGGEKILIFYKWYYI